MNLLQMLAYVTGMINQELLLQNEYLVVENRILKARIQSRLVLSEAEKTTLAEMAHRLGRKALEKVAGAAQPDTILGWSPLGFEVIPSTGCLAALCVIK